MRLGADCLYGAFRKVSAQVFQQKQGRGRRRQDASLGGAYRFVQPDRSAADHLDGSDRLRRTRDLVAGRSLRRQAFVEIPRTAHLEVQAFPREKPFQGTFALLLKVQKPCLGWLLYSV